MDRPIKCEVCGEVGHSPSACSELVTIPTPVQKGGDDD